MPKSILPFIQTPEPGHFKKAKKCSTPQAKYLQGGENIT
jgi:hypothetical protein